VTTHELEQTQQAWEAIAEGYDEFVTPTHMSLGGEALLLAGIAPGLRFLDVAAGSGALSLPAARLGALVTATDITPAMIERLAERARREGLDVATRVMDGHALELDDDHFDIAGSQYGVMLFPDLPRALREMKRVTRPGGRVFEPTASKELAAIYTSILDELGSQYVLGYVSDNAKRDGKFRNISVKLKPAGLKVRCRPGYHGPQDPTPPRQAAKR